MEDFIDVFYGGGDSLERKKPIEQICREGDELITQARSGRGVTAQIRNDSYEMRRALECVIDDLKSSPPEDEL